MRPWPWRPTWPTVRSIPALPFCHVATPLGNCDTWRTAKSSWSRGDEEREDESSEFGFSGRGVRLGFKEEPVEGFKEGSTGGRFYGHGGVWRRTVRQVIPVEGIVANGSWTDPWGRTEREVQERFRVQGPSEGAEGEEGEEGQGQNGCHVAGGHVAGGHVARGHVATAVWSKREAAKAALVKALRAVGLGPVYVADVAEGMSEYVDIIVVEAVALKRSSEHMEKTFRARCDVVIAKSSIPALVRWLKRAKVSKLKIASFVLLEEKQRLALPGHIEWLKKLGLEGNEAATLVKQNSHILEYSLQHLQDRLDRLSQAGVSPQYVQRTAARVPAVLLQSKDELNDRILFLQRVISKGNFQLGPIIRRFPAVLGRFTLKEMREKVAFLEHLGVSEGSLAAIVAEHPQVFGCDVEGQWLPLLTCLKRMGCSQGEIAAIIGKAPGFLFLNLETDVQNKFTFLERVGVKKSSLGGMIRAFPPFLTYDLDTRWRPLVQYLIEGVGIAPRDVASVLEREPEIFGCSISGQLEVTVRYFSDVGIQPCPSRFGRMVTEFPSLLTFSVYNLRPKWRYLRRRMGLSAEHVVAFPRFFGYRLREHIMLRHQLAAGHKLRLSLPQLLTCSDAVFASKLNSAVDPLQVDSGEE